ncbi:MAG: hypothetical protein IT386_02880 [Deltaproteobacteria bacterium]|nr:hypothetical protein [Deltaproteobacteria bacterium]
MSLAAALEHAATALPDEADQIRSANGDPGRLRRALSPQEAGRVLGWLLAAEAEAGEELATAWADDPDAAEHVLAASSEDLPKAGRKALRRVLHRLRGRGISVPEPKPEPVVATLRAVEEALDAALVTPLDPTGARIAYLVESNPGGGVRLFEIIFDATRGILDCAVYTSGRSGARKFLREAQSRRLPALPVPPDSLRRLLALAAAAQGSRSLPRSFTEWRSRLTRSAEGALTPGEMVRAALGTEGGSLSRALDLIRAREIGPWPPDEEPLRAVAERLQALAEGRIVVSGAQRREQVDAILVEALAGLYAGPEAERMALRFDEAAFVFWKQGREDDARACLAAADGFGDTGGGGTVGRALLEVALAPLLDRLREEEDSSLIVKP